MTDTRTVPPTGAKSELIADLTKRFAKVDALSKVMNAKEVAFLKQEVGNAEANVAVAEYGHARALLGEYLLQRGDDILAALTTPVSSSNDKLADKWNEETRKMAADWLRDCAKDAGTSDHSVGIFSNEELAELFEHLAVEVECGDRPARPVSAIRDKQDETAWLVEDNSDPRRYRTVTQMGPEWTSDVNQAIRFARRADAEMFATPDEDAWHIVEHMWCAPPEPKLPACPKCGQPRYQPWPECAQEGCQSLNALDDRGQERSALNPAAAWPFPKERK